MLVSQPLTRDNYSTWSRAIVMALTAKNKMGFINGTVKKSADNDPDFLQWSRCNDMVNSLLINSLSKELATSVIYAGSAQEIWIDLKERFSQVNAPPIFQIQHDISSLLQEHMPVVTYFSQLKSYWDELASLRSLSECTWGTLKALREYQDQEKTMQFFMGLNESYAAVCGQILLMDPLRNVGKAFSLVLQEEMQRKITANQSQPSKPAALIARSNPGHETPDTRNTNKKTQKGGKQLNREQCGWSDHTIDRCHKLHGYPPGHRLHKNVNTSIVNQVATEKGPSGPVLEDDD